MHAVSGRICVELVSSKLAGKCVYSCISAQAPAAAALASSVSHTPRPWHLSASTSAHAAAHTAVASRAAHPPMLVATIFQIESLVLQAPAAAAFAGSDEPHAPAMAFAGEHIQHMQQQVQQQQQRTHGPLIDAAEKVRAVSLSM